MSVAFVLGAGLGTRLRPLTNIRPKPLIPVWQQPLIVWAFQHLRSVGVERFVVNTHHLPEVFHALLPERGSHGWQIQYRHEPEILETGGGLANVLDLLGSEEPFFVYNGDILTDIDLVLAQQTHAEHKNLVTLILLPHGRVQNVAFDAQSGLVRDLRGALGAAHLPQYQFTGIYLVEPRFAAYLVPGKKESVVEAFLRAIRAGERIGGVLAAGNWWDLGDAQSYQEAHAEMGRTVFPRYSFPPEWKRPIHPSALLPEAFQVSDSCIGARARISADCTLEQCLVWPDAVVPGHTTARGKIFF